MGDATGKAVDGWFWLMAGFSLVGMVVAIGSAPRLGLGWAACAYAVVWSAIGVLAEVRLRQRRVSA